MSFSSFSEDHRQHHVHAEAMRAWDAELETTVEVHDECLDECMHVCDASVHACHVTCGPVCLTWPCLSKLMDDGMAPWQTLRVVS